MSTDRLFNRFEFKTVFGFIDGDDLGANGYMKNVQMDFQTKESLKL